MKTSIGRGRGYTSRNRDKKPGNLIIPDDNMHSVISSTASILSNTPMKSPQSLNPTLQSPPPNTVQAFQNPISINKKYIPTTSAYLAKSHINSQLPQVGFNQTSTKQSPNSVSNNVNYQNFDETENLDENIQSVLYIDEKYSYLIQQVNVLSVNDDGILTNQKLKYIEGVLNKECPQPQSLQNAMEAIASAAILDLNTATKVSKMMCSVSFSRVQIHQLRIYNVFISAVRDKIDGLELSLDGADQYLVNVSTLLTGIYSESKLLEPEELTLLANLIVQVFVGLLECNTSLALRTLNVQLMQFGSNLYGKVPEKLESISLTARKLLISRQPPPISSRIWLCLLSDQCLFEFRPLPKYLQAFYSTHLDDTQQENEPKSCRYTPKVPKDNLNVNKLPKTLNKNYENNQKSNQTFHAVKSDSSEKWSTSSNGDKNVHKGMHRDHSKDEIFEDKHYYEDPAVVDFYSSDISHEHHSNENSQTCQERKPRPILGAGARIAQQSKSDCENQFGEIPSHISYNHSYANEGSVEIPDFCPSIPPPNFLPPKPITSVGQDSGDFWNCPPPKITSLNVKSSLSNRLDLNSWRQQATKDGDQFTIYDPNEDKSGMNLNVQLSDENLVETVEALSIENKLDKLDDNISQVDSKREKSDTGVSFWNKKKPEDEEKNWSRSTGKQQDKKSFDWVKKDVDEKESNWRRRGSDEKNWEAKKNNWPNKKANEGSVHDLTENRTNKPKTESGFKNEEEDPGFDKRSSGRRDSRGNGRGPKRDFMEVPRKASYWTHDDRCDRDYDE